MARRRAVALVTYDGRPDLSRSDQMLIEPLRERGISAIAAVWNDPSVEWRRFDAVILRSCWDYHRHADQFRDWIRRMDESGIRLLNSAKAIEWNMTKTYIASLANSGVRTIPTLWASHSLNLEAALAKTGWDPVVLKPSIGASAEGIRLVAASDAASAQRVLNELSTRGTVMIQPVVPEIADGELSLVFFQERFAYAVRKRPPLGSIFVNSGHGGKHELAGVSSQLIEEASQILETARRFAGPEPFLYARVDGVEVDSHLVLMELELIEPGLFLDMAPSRAVERFADSIVRLATQDHPVRPPA